ncbi:MAG TPA: hypothetical protein VL793_06155, partial [Patescibacteria group bacterium]|nr:hypothetical protein [Patescibacteria group bacterium]
PSPYAYFRVCEGLVLTPALPVIASIAGSTNGLLLQWNAPTNLLFNVQWTTSLVPGDWHTLAGTVSSTNGAFLFLDDGTASGGFGTGRFYRLRQLP